MVEISKYLIELDGLVLVKTVQVYKTRDDLTACAFKKVEKFESAFHILPKSYCQQYLAITKFETSILHLLPSKSFLI